MLTYGQIIWDGLAKIDSRSFIPHRRTEPIMLPHRKLEIDLVSLLHHGSLDSKGTCAACLTTNAPIKLEEYSHNVVIVPCMSIDSVNSLHHAFVQKRPSKESGHLSAHLRLPQSGQQICIIGWSVKNVQWWHNYIFLQRGIFLQQLIQQQTSCSTADFSVFSSMHWRRHPPVQDSLKCNIKRKHRSGSLILPNALSIGRTVIKSIKVPALCTSLMPVSKQQRDARSVLAAIICSGSFIRSFCLSWLSTSMIRWLMHIQDDMILQNWRLLTKTDANGLAWHLSYYGLSDPGLKLICVLTIMHLLNTRTLGHWMHPPSQAETKPSLPARVYRQDVAWSVISKKHTDSLKLYCCP